MRNTTTLLALAATLLALAATLLVSTAAQAHVSIASGSAAANATRS